MNSTQALRAVRGEKALRRVEHLHIELAELATMIAAAKRLADQGDDVTLQCLLEIAHGTADVLANELDLVADPLPA